MFLISAVVIFIFVETTCSLSSDDFICTDGNIINIKRICNGKADCPDASDETKSLCYHTICPKYMFRCYYGACIPQSLKCNQQNDCYDKSDESQCGKANGSCESNQFRCNHFGCIPVAEVCNGVKSCPDGSDENEDLCEEFPCPEKSFRCKLGGCIHPDAMCDGKQDCIDASDESEILCKNLICQEKNCIKLHNEVHCPAIDISRLDATCQSKTGGLVPCDNPVPSGSKIKYECKPYFKPTHDKHKFNKHAECQLDGTWNREILTCEPECGEMRTDPVALVVKGWDTNKVVYPWHAQIYVKEEDKWESWCGGTLITEKVILTAAHCVWNVDANNVKLAFAKYHSEFHTHDPGSVIMNVKEIITQTVYQDRNGNFGSDITALVLEKSLTLTSNIHPACIDWFHTDMRNHLKEGSVGLVVGMGLTEEEEISKILMGTFLRVASNEKCLNEQVQDFRKYITYTVFCAGWKNGTGVCNGDSGGGLLFQKTGDSSCWILQGIVSVSPRKLGTSYCDPEYYTIFTNVGRYTDWLKDVLRKIHGIHNY